MAKGKRNRRKVSANAKAQNRALKRELFHSGQFKPQSIPNKKKTKKKQGFKDEYDDY